MRKLETCLDCGNLRANESIAEAASSAGRAAGEQNNSLGLDSWELPGTRQGVHEYTEGDE